MNKKITNLFFVISIIFIGLGIYRGEIDRVFIKATNICLECIGIG
ncbi:CD1871A family CXXC motif-containing protein [Clostridium rectalis]|nr:CD1871A family CXXC motif-containing protein [Clostridium rectalis]